MDYLIQYDKTSPISIETYSKQLIGKSFRDVLEAYQNSFRTENKSNKGNLGELIEENFFHYQCNSNSEPDFAEAGVELKVTPYKINKNGSYSAKERLVLTMIDYFAVANEKELESSHLWHKCKLMLLIYYLYSESIKVRLDYQIHFSKLFTPPEQDLFIIRNDYLFIINKIKSGLAHELSEADTLYLGTCTKAAKGTDRRAQPYSDIPAKPRAFAFKTSYMTYVLNNYIRTDHNTYEPILKEITTETFEEYVVKKISAYKGYFIDELCDIFGITGTDITKNKGIAPAVIYKILGIKGNKAEEFEKAGIVIKTIRVSEKGIRESMSFPNFKFKELIKEDWEDCTFGNYLRETKFLFVVFSTEENGKLYKTPRLEGCQFWNIPYTDLENEVKNVWERTKQVIIDGIQIKNVNGRMINNLPKMKENRVCHVRPHARNKDDTYELPDGRVFPKQCFWLNSSYIYEQLNADLK